MARTKAGMYTTRIKMPNGTVNVAQHDLSDQGYQDHIKYLEWKKSQGEIVRYSVTSHSLKTEVERHFVLVDFDHGLSQIITDNAEAVAAFEWAMNQPMLQNAVLLLFKLPFKGKPEPTVLAAEVRGRSPKNWSRIRKLLLQ